jgi:hypothetical protein
MSVHQIDQVQQRVRRYWFEDGIAELATGSFFILLGLYFGIQGYFGEGSLMGGILQVSMVLVFIGGFYLERRLIHSLKNRITYPRTGYVEYRVDEKNAKRRRAIAAVAGAGIAAALVFLQRSVKGVNMVVLVSGAVAAFIFFALPATAGGIKRFYLLGALSLALGIVLSLSGLPQAYGLALYDCLMGIAMMISGGLTLRRYLKDNPSVAEAWNGQ